MSPLTQHDSPSPPPVAVHGLAKSYGARRVLDDVSLEIQAGAVVGLIGRNGAGKSTLMQSMLGLNRFDAGDARVWGEPALALSDTAKARIGYVPQTPNALGWMSATAMLAFVGRFYPNWDAAFANELLARWELPAHTPLARLSPGERQRVAIIRALAPRPELLILDEPASALDPVARRDLLIEIGTRAGEFGCTVVFSTHIVSDLERVASHVAFLRQGRLLLHSELDALKERHLKLHLPAASAELLVGPVPGEVARRPNIYGGTSVLIVRDEGQDWPALARAPGVQRECLSLEDLFVEMAA